MDPCGKVTHYYDKLQVAIIELSKPLAVGDTVKIVGHDKEFTQEVTSIQKEHQSLSEAGVGDVVGIKVEQSVKEKDQVYKV